jgi:phosphatidylserine decarboxylase
MCDSGKSFFPRLARGAGRELTVVGILFLLALLAFLAWPGPCTFLLAGLLAALFALLLYFFRDPERISPTGERLILSPADGRVMEVRQAHEPRFLGGPGVKISVFMSLLNVHVNRAPVEGRVALVRHVPGRFLQAFRPEASDVNEHNLIGLESCQGRVLVKRVAGILARRIVCWVQISQEMHAGERLGVIKFGSRVELYLPLDVEPVVQVGDRVRAGVTVVARWKG